MQEKTCSTVRLAMMTSAAAAPQLVVAKTPRKLELLQPGLAESPSVAERSMTPADAAPTQSVDAASSSCLSGLDWQFCRLGQWWRDPAGGTWRFRRSGRPDLMAGVAHAVAYHEESGTLCTEFAEGGDLTNTPFARQLPFSTVLRLIRGVLTVLVNSPLHSNVITSNIVLAIRDERVVAKVTDWNVTTAPARGLSLDAATVLIDGFVGLLHPQDGDTPIHKLRGCLATRAHLGVHFVRYSDMRRDIDDLLAECPETPTEVLRELLAIDATDTSGTRTATRSPRDSPPCVQYGSQTQKVRSNFVRDVSVCPSGSLSNSATRVNKKMWEL